MKYRGGQHCIGCALGHALIEMLEAANAATGNHWNGYRLGDCTREFEIKALPCAVAIHAGEQNLAGAHLGDSGGPLQRIDSRRISAAMGEDLPMSANALGIDGHHPAMAPYLQGDTVSGPALQASAVVEAIQSAGGLALLAHPARYRLGFRPLLKAAAARGCDGAEVWYDYEMQEHWRPSPHVCEAISRLCGDLDLLQSCGTDSHGMSLKGR